MLWEHALIVAYGTDAMRGTKSACIYLTRTLSKVNCASVNPMTRVFQAESVGIRDVIRIDGLSSSASSLFNSPRPNSIMVTIYAGGRNAPNKIA